MGNQSSAENNNEVVDHHSHEFQETLEILISLQEFSQLLESQPKEFHLESQQRRQIQKVPPQIRLRRRQSEHVYNPVMVSIGPYHHGKPELSRAQEFKHLCLEWCSGGKQRTKFYFYNQIVEKIEMIRGCYADVTVVEKYDDKALALMVLLDACIIINFIHNCLYSHRNNYSDWQNCLGAGSGLFMIRDMFVLENQIPFYILKMLIGLQYEQVEAQVFVHKFLSCITRKDINLVRIPRENEDPPLHFLEACWRVVANKNYSPFRRREETSKRNHVPYAHRSVMDLKAKGIHIRPNSSPSLMDITFTSHAFYGQLQLPVQPVSDLSPVIFSNLIAYEVSPTSGTSQLVVLSYVILMKSLVQSSEDVKELQEKRVLLNKFANHEKAVELFKEIDTFGLHDQDIFKDIKHKIEEHCNSKAKTWIADLIHTRFRTPWTAIALLAAVFLLCLTFLQTFFTIHPI